jgi:hypothetical protein
MAQHDFNIANQGFPAFRSDLNDALTAINTSQSGTSRPSGAVAGTLWLDTTSATTPTLKYYDGADDISLATLDHTANTVNWLDNSVSFDIVNDVTPQLGGDLDLNSNDVTGTGDINITGSITASANLAGTLTTATQTNITSVGSLTSLNVNGTLLPYKAYIAEATLTDGATIDWNMATESVAKVTLADNRTLNAPTNGSTGQFASLLIIQDGTGTRTLTWNAVYEFATDTAPTLTATAGLADLFTFRYNGTKWLEVGRNLALTVA